MSTMPGVRLPKYSTDDLYVYRRSWIRTVLTWKAVNHIGHLLFRLESA